MATRFFPALFLLTSLFVAGMCAWQGPVGRLEDPYDEHSLLYREHCDQLPGTDEAEWCEVKRHSEREPEVVGARPQHEPVVDHFTSLWRQKQLEAAEAEAAAVEQERRERAIRNRIARARLQK